MCSRVCRLLCFLSTFSEKTFVLLIQISHLCFSLNTEELVLRKGESVDRRTREEPKGRAKPEQKVLHGAGTPSHA